VPQPGVAGGVSLDEAIEDKPPRRRARRILLVIALVLLGGLIALWTQRKPIAASYVDRALRGYGVPARYRIADLGFNRQRLTNVSIGDPAHPDLVADWIELRTNVGLSGAEVTAVRAGHVRMNARLVDGRISLGMLDKFMPAPSGKPFALPALRADLQDVRIRLVAPQGVVGLKLSGAGVLNDGFAGQVAAITERLDLGTCVSGPASAVLAVRIADGRPSLRGPVHAGALECAGARLSDAGADLSVALDSGLSAWRGDARIALARLRHSSAELRALSGTIDFAGSAAGTSGKLDLKSGIAAVRGAGAQSLALAGSYQLGKAGIAFDGKARARHALLGNRVRTRLLAYRNLGAGTPVSPLVARAVEAAMAAARSVDMDVDFSVALGEGRGQAKVSRLQLASASGAWATIGEGDGIGYAWPGSGLRFDGLVDVGGGNLPTATVRIAQARAGGPVSGTATIQPYAAGRARLALTPVSFAETPGGITRISTRVTLSGPLGDGHVEGLTLPVAALWDGRDRIQVNRTCAPLSIGALAVSSFRLRSVSVPLCPIDGAMLRYDRGRVGGGVRSGAMRLAGAIGSSPFALSTGGLMLRLQDMRADLQDVEVGIGPSDRQTRLSFARVEGGVSGGVLAGTIQGGGGRIANVPLVMSDAAAPWTFARGALELTGGTLRVADAAAAPRFNPLLGNQVALRLADGRITATGRLETPDKGILVSNVAIEHDLSDGKGHADLGVPGIAFGDALQPDQLTPLTFGVIANVVGTVSGEGHIRWNADGVTSDGIFRTPGTDLAAAFGPVTGVAGEIRFTDLLNLESAPGQVATVKTVNPGIAVNDGTIRYRLLAGTRVQVEGGRWPFAGGSLVLEPTMLDFGQRIERRMTFTVTSMDAGQFLQQFDFKNLNATGTFDGTLPMVFDEQGGRIENGRLTVRVGGGTLAYVGEISQKDVGMWGNLAFQALKSLRYRYLELVMNGPLAGEMVTEVRFAGVGQGEGAKRNFIIDRLQKLPFVFNIRIRAPFRGLIDSAASFYDPKRLIQRNLPALLEEQRKRAKPPVQTPPPIQPIQPAESEKLP